MLRTRLFLWLLGAMALAVISTLVVQWTRPEAATGGEVVARTVSAHLEEVWDNDRATDAYLEEVREVTGFQISLHRGPHNLPPNVKRVAHGGGVIASGGPHHVFVPVVRGARVLGALEMERFGYRPQLIEWWRVIAGIVVAVVVLAIAASFISSRFARPLEQLGTAADRFGGGDLGFRTDLAAAPRRKSVATEVRGVAVAFNKMADRLEGMVRGQRELLGAISHELRSPLGRARVALEIARDRVADVEAEGPLSARRSPSPQLDEIERQLHATDRILGDLLSLTRAGLADLRREPVPLVPWLRARVADEPKPPVVELLTSLKDDRKVSIDAALFARVVHNLIANARVHGHPDAVPLVVSLEQSGERLALVVADRGPGFPAELLGRAFEPFVRGDAARSPRAAGGSGLGLALVRRIAEAHGGEAFARNREGGGAEVGVLLPDG